MNLCPLKSPTARIIFDVLRRVFQAKKVKLKKAGKRKNVTYKIIINLTTSANATLRFNLIFDQFLSNILCM